MSVTAPALFLLYLTGFLGFAFWKRKELLPILSGAGRPAGYFAVISVCGLLLAQALVLGDAIYPYSNWTMYTHPEPYRSTWDFRLVRSSGREERLSPRRILAEPNPRPLMGRLYGLASRLDESEAKTRSAAEAELGEALAALARLDSRRRTGDPVQRIDVLRCAVTESPMRSPIGVDCEDEPIASYSLARPHWRDGHAP